MLSNINTLIVFDTNILRRTLSNGLTYHEFSFTNEYEELEDFIKKNNLNNLIHISIPKIVIKELCIQKISQFNGDKNKLKEILNRLRLVIDSTLFEREEEIDKFDCDNYVRKLIDDFIIRKDLKIIDFPDRKISKIFERIVKRALEKKPPFNKSSGAGFKDVLIWESLLNYKDINNYNMVIFITNDKGFNNDCINEFRNFLDIEIKIKPTINLAMEEIKSIYKFNIEDIELIKFVEKDYFRDYIKNELNKLNTIVIENKEFSVVSFKVIDYLDNVDNPKNLDDEALFSIVVVSKVKASVKRKDKKKEIIFLIKTYLDDSYGILNSEVIFNNE